MEIRSVDGIAIQLLSKRRVNCANVMPHAKLKKAWCEGLHDSIKTITHTSQFISTGNERRCLELTVLTLTDQITGTNTGAETI